MVGYEKGKICYSAGKHGSNRRYTKDEIIKIAHEFVRNNADYIVLRTTEFYSIPKLLELVKELRIKIPGDYKIVFNTNEKALLGYKNKTYTCMSKEATILGELDKCITASNEELNADNYLYIVKTNIEILNNMFEYSNYSKNNQRCWK